MKDHLQELYPFLHGRERRVTAMDEALQWSLQQKARDGLRIKMQFFSRCAEDLVSVAHTMAERFRRGGCLLCMGNGGSSCDAAHLAVEFLHPVTAGRPALPAVDLGASNATLTALANDVGVEQIYLRQVAALGDSDDVLVGFSTSGNSANLLEAFARAWEMGIATVALAGGDGGVMARSPYIDHCLVVPSDSVHRIQETHLACYHILWDLVHTLLADSRGDLQPGGEAAG
ncbi:SIS domain-containing protein [Microbulbifer sp. SAOS-129_SWC]|uniref:D-sedoheptulose-7-phosphate isomerase n=1 Tax=Microbulbifer sp. SAOS-129_SWC TaxID=3145235 RepID=UPI003216E841